VHNASFVRERERRRKAGDVRVAEHGASAHRTTMWRAVKREAGGAHTGQQARAREHHLCEHLEQVGTVAIVDRLRKKRNIDFLYRWQWACGEATALCANITTPLHTQKKP